MRPSPPHGVLLIDKPVGISSFDVLRRLRRVLRTKKLGHAGTLDPFASGLLVVCAGEYTRFAGYMTEDDKVYDAEVALGAETNTDDLEGEVIAQAPRPDDWSAQLDALVPSFTGPLQQVPPQFSAIHVNGQRAYAMARRGEEVALAAREVVVHSLELQERLADGFRMRVSVSKGTYIRALARDIGRSLGCGGHLRALRRTASGPFEVRDAWSLEALEAAAAAGPVKLLQGRDALVAMPALVLDEDDQRRMRFGQASPHPETAHGVYALYTDEGALLGLGEVFDEQWEDAEGVAHETRVLRVRRLLPT